MNKHQNHNNHEEKKKKKGQNHNKILQFEGLKDETSIKDEICIKVKSQQEMGIRLEKYVNKITTESIRIQVKNTQT